MNGTDKLIAVTGPTASGKTALGVHLAGRFGGEVISADSMQIYTGMDIAVAMPSEEEMQGVPHRLMGFISPGERFSVARYTELANKAADDILSRGKIPVVVGGTGLYIDSFLGNTVFAPAPADDELRRTLHEKYAQCGGEKMLSELSEFDGKTAARLSPNDEKRIVRAFEIYLLSGVPISEQTQRSHSAPKRFEVLYLGIDFRDREKLYRRIDTRVDEMLERGLLDEARAFFAREVSETAVKAIGYKELLPYLTGDGELSDCVETLKRETRRYAKRQLTWFRRNKSINVIYADDYDTYDGVFETADKLCEDFLGGVEREAE